MAYWLATRLRKPLFTLLRRFSSFSKAELPTRNLLGKYGFLTVFITRFVIISLGAAASYLSGLENLDRKKYFLAVVSGELLYAIIYPTLGYFGGAIFGDLIRAISNAIVSVFLLGVIIYFIYYLFKRRMNKGRGKKV